MTTAVLLLPRLDRLLAALPGQDIWQWLGRSDRSAAAPASARAIPHAMFEVVPEEFAQAAVARHGECDDAGMYSWLRADPCWLQPDMNSLRMMAWGQMSMSPKDAEDLAAILRPLLGDEGFEFSIPHPERWYLRLPLGSELPRFSHPQDVLGDDVERHLPPGNSGLRWRRLLNEVQMSLHQHPVSQRREAAGMAPVNSLWFWGGGRLPNRVRAARSQYFSDDPIMRGLARQAAVPCSPTPTALNALAPMQRSGVFDLRTVAPTALNADWLEPFIQRLRSADLDEIVFGFAAGERFQLRRGHRWRFWRKPLAGPIAGPLMDKRG